MSTLPRYKFDPVTQKYTFLTPQEQQMEQQRDMQSGGGSSDPSGPSGPGGNPAAGSSGTVGGFGQSMMGYGELGFAPGSMAAGVVGGLMADQSIAQNAAVDAAIAEANAMGAPVGVSMGAFGPTATTDPGAIAGLAAMNNAVAASMQAEAANAAQAQAAAEAAEAASQAAASPGVGEATGEAAADAGADASGGGGDGGGDGGGNAAGDASAGAGDSSGEKEGGLISIKKYVNGGMAMAPQNYGRMGDSMLVHMSPREVAGLQSLARSQGTSLTVNPNTGYPEAFNLSALLPMAAGFALGPGGFQAMSAAQAGMLVGGLTAAATGSLKKGLQAGLGAYGGAGLGEGLVTPQTPAAAGMEGAIGSGITPTPAPTTVPTAPVTDPLAATYNLPPQAPTGVGISPTVNTNLGFEGAPPFGATNVQPTALNLPSSTATTARTAGLSTAPDSSKFIGNLSGRDALKYGTAALASIPPPEYEPPQSTAMLRPYDYSFNPVTGAYDPRPGDSSEILYGRPTFTPGEVVPARSGGMMNSYAAGGLAAFKEGGRTKGRPLMDDRGLAGLPYYEFMGEQGSNLGSVEKNFAAGGRTPANGKFLMGDGDGMSDNIPATIADKQPARLADGEFVIPADVVSHIGNGSSKAGAKKLYKMMADIRKERTGKTKQAPAIKPERHMPA
jgi:hypothetical protein